MYSFSIISEHLYKNTYNEIKDIPVKGGCGTGKLEYGGTYYEGMDLGNEVQMWILNANQNDTSDALCLTHTLLQTSNSDGKYSFKNIWHIGPIKVNQKFSWSTLGFSISVLNWIHKPRFWNPSFQIRVSQQLLTLFLGFVQASAVKPGVLNLFLSSKNVFQTQLFKTRVLTQTDIENLKKYPFQTWKRHFLVYFNRANTWQFVWRYLN